MAALERRHIHSEIQLLTALLAVGCLIVGLGLRHGVRDGKPDRKPDALEAARWQWWRFSLVAVSLTSPLLGADFWCRTIFPHLPRRSAIFYGAVAACIVIRGLFRISGKLPGSWKNIWPAGLLSFLILGALCAYDVEVLRKSYAVKRSLVSLVSVGTDFGRQRTSMAAAEVYVTSLSEIDTAATPEEFRAAFWRFAVNMRLAFEARERRDFEAEYAYEGLARAARDELVALDNYYE